MITRNMECSRCFQEYSIIKQDKYCGKTMFIRISFNEENVLEELRTIFISLLFIFIPFLSLLNISFNVNLYIRCLMHFTHVEIVQN